jgi:hypothetical protein
MQSLDDLIHDLEEAQKRVQYDVMRKAPAIMGQIAVRNIQQNFKEQGYDGEGWESRSAATNKIYLSPEYKAAGYSPTNPLLLQSLTLYNCIRSIPFTHYVWVGVRDQYHMIGNRQHNVADYAKGNNEGTATVPQRKFMPKAGEGIPYRWQQQIVREINLEMDKAMRNFKT